MSEGPSPSEDASLYAPDPTPAEPAWEPSPAPGPTGPRSRRLRRGAIALASAAALTGIGVGVASAATSSNTSPGGSAPGTSSGGGSGGSTSPAPPGGPGGGPFGRGHDGPGFGFGGPGMLGGGPEGGGPGGVLHGTFVTVKPGSSSSSPTYQTNYIQRGTVQNVSTDSIEVKSADGYDQVYSVTTNTLVDSGRDGIANVAKGDTVMVSGVEPNGSTAVTASNISDMTRLGAIRQYWRPAPPAGTSANT